MLLVMVLLVYSGGERGALGTAANGDVNVIFALPFAGWDLEEYDGGSARLSLLIMHSFRCNCPISPW